MGEEMGMLERKPSVCVAGKAECKGVRKDKSTRFGCKRARKVMAWGDKLVKPRRYKTEESREKKD